MRTLLVEDDPTTRRFLLEILEGLGNEVTAFDGTDAAWAAYQARHFPLVVLDWRMPEGQMDGLELCRCIRAHPGGSKTLILVITVRSKAGDLEAVLDAGADDYVPKPVTPEDLKTRVRIAQARIREIAARSSAERALATTQNHLDSVIANAPLVLFLIDRAGVFTFAQGRGLQSLGLTPDDIVGQSIFDLYKGQPDIASHVSRALAGEAFNEEVELRDVTLESWYAPLPDEQGVMIVATDVTKRTLVERGLREEEERFRRFVDAAFEGIALIENRRVIDANSQAAEMFGFTVADIIGRRAMDFVDAEDHHRFFQFLRERRTDPFELTGVRRDGSTFQIEARMRRLPFHGRDLLVAAVQDVTARRHVANEHRKLEEQMRQAQKLESLGVLAGGIAHDFNNLLMGVLGNASLALMDLEPDSSATEFIHQIETAAQRAADLTNQMLAFSGKGKFVVTRVNLSETIREMKNFIESIVGTNIDVQYRLDDDLPEIAADPGQIRQVLVNLISNASEAAGDRPGIIRVATGVKRLTRENLDSSHIAGEVEAGAQVFVEIRDAGGGMDEPTLARIFDPFFTTKFTGRGLGMAAVLGIVRGHKGAIKIASQPQQGTTVTVLFPPAGGPALVTDELEPTTAPQPAKAKVLIVDDEQTVLSVTSQMLERMGFEVLTAQNGNEALEQFQAHRHDVSAVLLDLTMPDLNGDQVFARMRELDPQVRVILMSGYTEKEATHHFTGQGLSGFVQKPFTPSLLRDRIQAVLEERSA